MIYKLTIFLKDVDIGNDGLPRQYLGYAVTNFSLLFNLFICMQ